jgi:predicted RNase H-like HicB family nuclease
MIFHVTLESAEDGWLVAECPALPGCVSQGRDEKEALENIKEAITAWLWAEDHCPTPLWINLHETVRWRVSARTGRHHP